MNKKYIKYINYIINDIELPYFKCMVDHYGLKDNEYPLVLSKVFNQPVTIEGGGIYDSNNNLIYYEDITGCWEKRGYDSNNNRIYCEDSNGVIRDNRYE